MTEADWLNSEDPARMLDFVTHETHNNRWHHRAMSGHQRRLFACACLRAVGRKPAEVDVWEKAGNPHGMPDADWAIAWAAQSVEPHLARPQTASFLREIYGNPFRTASVCGSCPPCPPGALGCPSCARILAWEQGTIPRLAERIYQERAFDRMPILADALEEAGCTEEEVLRHCRGQEWCWSCRGEGAAWQSCDVCNPQRLSWDLWSPWVRLRGPHVRGCWLIDLLTGRS